jgi:hypothetical protein
MRRKVIASILCLVFLFTVSGMALGAPQNGLYVNGHRYDLTLSKNDAAYLKFLGDLKAIAWDWSKIIIVNNNQFADYQDAVDEGSIDDVLQDDAQSQVGGLLPTSVIPIANNGTESPSEPVGDTGVEDTVYASTNALANTAVSVPNGTAEADALALLDATVGVVGTNGETGSASIAWAIAGYDGSTAGEYDATGVLTLPAGWTGSALDVTATVTVQDVIPPAYASTNALANTAVSVPNGTAEADALALLDTTVGVVGTNGETGSASIAWTIAGYDGSTAGEYDATGVLTLPAGWTGSALDVTATVTVQDVIPPAYASTNALANTAVSVANGTAEADAIALLDTSVGVVGTNGETGSASIAWTIAGYDGSTAGEYDATGVLTLPAGWTGSALDVTATVTVQDVIPPAYASTNALANTAVSVANGTAEADAIALLDTSVGVVGTNGETGSASIAWTIAGYDADTAGDYTATGVLTLPGDWTGTASNVTATVTVEAPLPPAYASTAALTTTTVTVENGTAEAAAIAQLDKTVVVIGTLGEIGSADIAWTIANYDANTAGNYTATGVLTLPGDWTGTAPNVSATVTVEAPLPPAYASTAALTTTTVTVENGTAEAAAIAQLQTSVGVTGTKGETGTASIAWTIAAYNATTAGDYTATGVLTLPTDWTGTAPNVTATVTVEAPAGFSTAVEVIQNAIANFQPVNAAGKFGGKVYDVKVVGTVTVNKCDFKADKTSISAAKVQTATMTVNITPQVQTSDKDVTTANFPFAEIISGAGIGANAVAGGVLTQDADFYYIQLTKAACPTSVLNIIDAAGNVSSGTKMNFTDQKADCQIKVSKATGRVVSVDNITITGKTNVTKSTLNLANGTYNNEFWNNGGPITYTYK